jgi:toxin-antitoxin system, toxin component, bro domain protein
MGNQIQVFNNPQFGEIRTAGSADNPMFCLTDVCRVLELQVSPTKNRLKQTGVNLIKVGVQTGVKRNGSPATQEVDMIFINEQNLYKVIMRSDKPQAEKFQDWVCGDVLPSIRKTGGYIATTQEDTPELIMARALQVAQTTIDKHQQMLEQANERIVLQSEQLKQQAPKVKSYDEYISSEGTFSATQIAKEYGWGAKTLNNKLREMGVQYKQHGQWLLFAKYSGKGYTKSVPHAFTHADGRVDVRMSTVWTAKGREYIHSLLNAGQPGMLNFKEGGNK